MPAAIATATVTRMTTPIDARDLPSLMTAAELAVAMRSIPEFALESSAQGRAFLGTVLRAWPDAFLADFAARLADSSPAVPTAMAITKEDQLILTRAGALPPERIMGMETGGCLHTAIREDVSIHLAATFSPELADLTIHVIDVAAGEEIPRKGGSGITRLDLLVVNKIDLAPHVGADLVFTNLKTGDGVGDVCDFIIEAGGLEPRHAPPSCGMERPDE